MQIETGYYCIGSYIDNSPLALLVRLARDKGSPCDIVMVTVGYASKSSPSLYFLENLHDHARAAVETWLRAGFI